MAVPPRSKARAEKLRQEIDYHRYLYHVEDRQEISDAALDSLKKELADIERMYPSLITPDSPTQRVGGQVLSQFKKIAHSTPMLSLEDAFTREDLEQWEERNHKILPQSFEYFVEPKIDGVAISLIYEDGLLIHGVTRGDGGNGEDVTQNIKTIEAIPLKVRRVLKGQLEVRGEVYMPIKGFLKLNAVRKKAKLPPFANPRNIVAGSLRQLDPRIAQERPLHFFAWEITQGMSPSTRQEEYEELKKLGFPVPPHAHLIAHISELEKYLAQEEKARRTYSFQVDGVVIKINSLSHAKRLGIIGKAPRSAIAYKFAAEEATTVVKDIIVQVGRTGALTPVAYLEPVRVFGTTVSRATLHNAEEVARKDIRIGDTVIVRKAGDIIPEIVKTLPRLRPSKSQPWRMPKRCPICRSPVLHQAGEVVWRCSNPNCFHKQRERILHAVDRAAFAIDGVGEKIVEYLLELKLVSTPPELWEITAADLEPLEGFGEVSAHKLIAAIARQKNITLSRFLVALSIPHVGTVTAYELARHFCALEKIQRATQEELTIVEGIGEKVAHAIANFFAEPMTKKLINHYQKVGVMVSQEKTGGPLTGQTFIFTGSLPGMTREEAKQRVRALGGRCATTVGPEIDVVVAGEDPGSKVAKAVRLKLKVISPEEFFKLVEASI